MKTPPKKASKPKVKLSRAAGARGAEVISLVERTSGHPSVNAFLFDGLAPSTGVVAVAGVELFLKRIGELRALAEAGEPTPPLAQKGVDAENAKGALAVLAQRKLLDPAREAWLHAQLEAVRRGAQPEEVVIETEDPRRLEMAGKYVAWLNEWREIARLTISRRDYLISLGLARRRTTSDSDTSTTALP